MMNHGKEVRSSKGEAIQPGAANEIMALMFVRVEQAPGAFSLRFVSNDDLLRDLQSQNMLQSFLDDVDRLYTDFCKRFSNTRSAERPIEPSV